MKRNYAKILLEETEKTAQAQAPEGSELGLYAWAPQRIKRLEPNLPEEPNTQIERELYIAIRDHVEENIPFDPKYTALIKKFIENGWYSKIIKPPAVGTMIHRGVLISLNRLRKILGLNETDKIPGFEGTASVDYVWKHPSGENFGSSWTKKYELARNFDKDITIKRPISAVFTAAPGQEKNFLDLTPTEGEHSGFYRFIDTMFHKEDECTALGPVKVSQISWSIKKELKHRQEIVDNVEERLVHELCKNAIERNTSTSPRRQ